MSVLEALLGFSAFSLHQGVLDDGGEKKTFYAHTAANDTAHVMCVETNNSCNFAKRK